jgi:hypothetical protein
MTKKRKPQRNPESTPGPDDGTTTLPARAAAALWMLGAGLGAWSFGYTVMRGSDLWWHVAAGRWMLANRSLPSVDPWSFTRAGQPWLHHEWLSDVVYALWADAFGLSSLAWWKWGVIVATVLALFAALRRAGASPAAAGLSAWTAAAVSAPFLDIRPHLYSLLGYALLLRLAWVRPRPPGWMWALPVLFLVWANLHGGFFFGLLALSALLAPDLLWGSPRERRTGLLAPLLCALAALGNPNGWHAFAYPLKYAADPGSPFRSLREWHPPWVPGGIEAPLFWPAAALFLVAAAVWLARGGVARRDRVGAGAVLLGALTLAMALRSRRFIPLFAVSQALLLAPLLGLLLRRVAAWVPAVVPRWAAPAALCVLALLRLAPYPQSGAAFSHMTHLDSFPVDTLDFVETNGLRGKLFAYYNWGGYVHLRTQGALQVFIDGRADTVYDAETYLRYVAVLGAEPGWRSVVESSGAGLFLWPVERGAQLDELTRDGSWVPIYRDSVSVLLARADRVPERRAPPPDSAYRFLSLGAQILQSVPWPCDDARCRERLALAARFLERSAELDPGLGATCFNLARVRAALGRLEEARATMGRCEDVFPSAQRREAFARFVELLQTTGAASSRTAPSPSGGPG